MKTILLTLVGVLALMLVGCDVPDADFVSYFPVVKSIIQSEDNQKNHEALYIISCFDKKGNYHYTVKIILPNNFAQIGQHLYFSNGTNMYAGPMELEKNITR